MARSKDLYNKVLLMGNLNKALFLGGYVRGGLVH